MSSFFKMSDLGQLTYYLGIEVEQGDGFIKLKQTRNAKKIFNQGGLGDCNPTKFPMDPKEQLTKDKDGKRVDVYQTWHCICSWHCKQIYGASNSATSECIKKNTTLYKRYSGTWFRLLKEGWQQNIDGVFR